jgi:hypothetical protein
MDAHETYLKIQMNIIIHGWHDLWNKFFFENILLILQKRIDATITSGKFYSLS